MFLHKIYIPSEKYSYIKTMLSDHNYKMITNLRSKSIIMYVYSNGKNNIAVYRWRSNAQVF